MIIFTSTIVYFVFEKLLPPLVVVVEWRGASERCALVEWTRTRARASWGELKRGREVCDHANAGVAVQAFCRDHPNSRKTNTTQARGGASHSHDNTASLILEHHLCEPTIFCLIFTLGLQNSDKP